MEASLKRDGKAPRRWMGPELAAAKVASSARLESPQT